ncbi:hypothetical protein Trydic_g5657 [Trypoxylus dichotomus]
MPDRSGKSSRYNKSERAIKGVNLRDQIRSKKVREDLEIQDIIRVRRGKQQFWRDQVDKMTEGVWRKWEKDEKPNPTRPRKRWCGSWTPASEEAKQH